MKWPKFAFDWRAPPDWLRRAIVFLLALGVLVPITTRWNRWESNAAVFKALGGGWRTAETAGR